MWTSRLLATSTPRATLIASTTRSTRVAATCTRAVTTSTTTSSPSSSASESSSEPISSTSAISYKRAHPAKHHPSLSSYYHPAPSAQEAVSNILYNTPSHPRRAEIQRHIFNCLVQNEPGVLSRVSGILAGRGFNIDSLVVARTEVSDLSRMTIVVRGEHEVVEQARRQLEDLVPVWAVLDYTGHKIIQRELLLVKVSILGPEHVLAQMKSRRTSLPSATDLRTIQQQQKEQQDWDNEIEIMSPSDALRQTHDHLHALTELTELFQGKVVDVSSDCMSLELSAKPDRVNAFLKLLQPFGILEAARSGMMAMPRSMLLHDRLESESEEQVEDVGSGVDAAMLPPG
ncbi:MAG: small subunit of acetolactate synthase-domain-containing protein [Linnemannia gamsii]|nr:MAG: small subunit of acetolactate synthase-domain-containing protein [Linnemannia gamsii]